MTTVRATAPRHERHASQGHPATHNALLNLVLVAGAILVAALVIGATNHLGVMKFRSDSMAPAYPTGTVVLVRTVPASEVHVGDVVTVDRGGALPITHRVVATRTARDGMTNLTLRGDANPTADPQPYRVSEVRLVETSLPDASRSIAMVGGGVLAIGLVALVAVAIPMRKRRTLA